MAEIILGGFAMAGICMLITSVWLAVEAKTKGNANLTTAKKVISTIAAAAVVLIILEIGAVL